MPDPERPVTPAIPFSSLREMFSSRLFRLVFDSTLSDTLIVGIRLSTMYEGTLMWVITADPKEQERAYDLVVIRPEYLDEALLILATTPLWVEYV